MDITTGVRLHKIQTKKFKDIGISIRFQNTLERKTACARSLLALMLCDRSKHYDTKKKMSDEQDALYGATLNAQTAGYGSSQIIEIRSKIIHPCFVDEKEDILTEWLSFLKEILFSPLLSEEAFEESKHILLSKIKRMLDDPAQYVINECLKLAGKNTSLGISALGEKQDVEALCLDDVKKVYEDMIQHDQIDIMICGDIQEDMMETIASQLNFTPRKTAFESYYVAQNDLHAEVAQQYKNISQSYIMMTWFTNTSAVDKDYYALRVANAMFGQYSTSLLFQEVREKNSLCYSIFSNLISYDAALGVTTGIEKENIEKTRTLIMEQFERLKNGDFKDELMEVSKTMIINSLRASDDSMNSLIALAYQNTLLQRNYTSEDIISLIQKVTREDVLRVISRCELKQTLIVTKEDDAHDQEGE